MKHDVEIIVEANLYGGTFRINLTPRSYQINLAGEVAVTDMTVIVQSKNLSWIPAVTTQLKMWDRLPCATSILPPEYLEKDISPIHQLKKFKIIKGKL